MPPVVLFDVNETLLDLSPIDDAFEKRYGEALDASTWFSELLRSSFVSSVTDTYQPFTTLAAAALLTVADRAEIDLDDADTDEIIQLMTSLHPHADVRTGLATLADAGVRTAALTNSPHATAITQLTNAGLIGFFDDVMSVEMVRRFKPHRSVYEAAASRMGVTTSGCVMVAAHDWDIAGAQAAGCTGVFVARPGQTWNPAFGEPDAVVPTIEEAALSVVGRRHL